MALHMTVPTARLTLAVCLSALFTACSFSKGPSVVVVDAPAQINDRFDEDGLSNATYTTVVPRAFIDVDNLDNEAPAEYTVVRGDTLWDISDRFLKKPWLWTEIWNYNPQIYNPHLIYPGDVLALEYVNGQPTLVLTRHGKPVPLNTPALGAAHEQILDSDGNPVGNSAARTRLSPRIRSESLDDAIPTIAADSIQQFLVHPRVVDASTIARAPYVVGNHDSRLISAVGHRVFARGQMNRDQTAYGIFRRNKELRDPTSNALLGYEVTHVADAKLLNVGEPSTLAITRNKMETMAGDLLLPTHEGSVAHAYVPRLPELKGEGRIVSLVNAISQTGRDQVIVLNIGSESSIQEGDVLAIESRGKRIIDPLGRGGYERLKLPNQRTGVVMVFKTFDKVSYGLVMESTRPVMVNDIITGI
ncbi:MAG: LysM peptidoglycan-binding domain-containing protein [Granulosicoccus sp.]|nr:LysM peptidoglycan-binding domain-containing protein [Granulosicoccus sp.]